MRYLVLFLLLAALPSLAGCFGAAGVPLPLDELIRVRNLLEELDRDNEAALKARIRTLQEEVAAGKGTKDRALRSQLARKRLLLGYSWERLGEFKDANDAYIGDTGTEYGAIALFRTTQVAEYQLSLYEHESQDPDTPSDQRAEAKGLLQLERKRAMQALERASNFPVGARTLVRTPEVGPLLPATWESRDTRKEAYSRLDKYYRGTKSYQAFEVMVRICGGPKHNYSYVLCLVLLAVLAKLITTPLSLAQFKSMRAMQAVQPELKKLQEKHKGDKSQMARAQMALFKEHKINPASSCLPMLIQLPILMWVYWGIRHFTYRFLDVPFLYMPSLGDPDVLRVGEANWPGPMLVIYGLSMYFSQKLMSTPTATPEQQQQQKLMAILMPVMFVVLFRSLPAAFILYWLLMNILMTGHQYLIMRARPVPEAATPASPGGPPPPEAIQKLAKETKPSQKKKKKRRG